MSTIFLVSTRPEGKYSAPKRRYCFSLVNVPVTEVHPADAFTIDEFLRFNADVSVFTSSVGSSLFLEKFGLQPVQGTSILCIGRETARPFIEAGAEVTLPANHDSAGLAELLAEKYSNRRIALLTSDSSNLKLRDFLDREHFIYRYFTLYRVGKLRPDLSVIGKDDCIGVLLTSPIEASVVIEFLRESGIRPPPIYAIGRTTADYIETLGFTVSAEVPNSSFAEALSIIDNKICKKGE